MSCIRLSPRDQCRKTSAARMHGDLHAGGDPFGSAASEAMNIAIRARIGTNHAAIRRPLDGSGFGRLRAGERSAHDAKVRPAMTRGATRFRAGPLTNRATAGEGKYLRLPWWLHVRDLSSSGFGEDLRIVNKLNFCAPSTLIIRPRLASPGSFWLILRWIRVRSAVSSVVCPPCKCRSQKVVSSHCITIESWPDVPRFGSA